MRSPDFPVPEGAFSAIEVEPRGNALLFLPGTYSKSSPPPAYRLDPPEYFYSSEPELLGDENSYRFAIRVTNPNGEKLRVTLWPRSTGSR